MGDRRVLLRPSRRTRRETLRGVTPWYARLRAEDRDDAPALVSFGVDEFVEAFLRGVGDSGPSASIDAFEPLLPYRDYSEPPAAMLDASGDPRYPDDVPRVLTQRIAGEVPAPKGEPAWVRKLYPGLHRRYTVVGFELVCEHFGPRRVADRRVREVGCIVRRLVPDSRAKGPQREERWEDWVPLGEGEGRWIELADAEMVPFARAGAPLLPTELAHPIFGAGDPDSFRAALGLGVDEPTPASLDALPMAPLPKELGAAAEHSSWFAYLPVSSGDEERALEGSAPTVGTRQRRLVARAHARLASVWLGRDERAELELVTPTEADPFALPTVPVHEVREFVMERRDDARALLAKLFAGTVRPANAPSWDGLITRLVQALAGTVGALDAAANRANAEAALVKELDAALRDGRSAWLADALPRQGETIDDARLVPSWESTGRGRAAAAFPEKLPIVAVRLSALPFPPTLQEVELDLRAVVFDDDRNLLEALLDRRQELTLDGILRGGDATRVGGDDDRLELVLVALMLVRRARLSIAAAFRALHQPDERDELAAWVEIDGERLPASTLGSLGAEVELWLEGSRGSLPSWSAPTPLAWVGHHVAAADLESRSARDLERTLGAGLGVARWWQERLDALRARIEGLAGLGGKSSRAVALDPEEAGLFALLVVPGLEHTAESLVAELRAAALRASKADVAGELERADARARPVRAPRPRYDAHSIYTVWCYARVAGKDGPCEREKVVWSGPSERFQIADPTDLLGQRPARLPLPDLKKLARDLPRLARAKARPLAAVDIPEGSRFSVSAVPLGAVSLPGLSMVCTYGIPVFTICAWVLFMIVFSILSILPGFTWMLLLKFCAPAPRGR